MKVALCLSVFLLMMATAGTAWTHGYNNRYIRNGLPTADRRTSETHPREPSGYNHSLSKRRKYDEADSREREARATEARRHAASPWRQTTTRRKAYVPASPYRETAVPSERRNTQVYDNRPYAHTILKWYRAWDDQQDDGKQGNLVRKVNIYVNQKFSESVSAELPNTDGIAMVLTKTQRFDICVDKNKSEYDLYLNGGRKGQYHMAPASEE